MQTSYVGPLVRTPHRVVIIGSGFGGLFGTRRSSAPDVEITLIAPTTHHLFQPLLYQVATGILSEGEIAPAPARCSPGQKNARVVLGDVTDIDLEARTVTSRGWAAKRSRRTTRILAAGAGQS